MRVGGSTGGIDTESIVKVLMKAFCMDRTLDNIDKSMQCFETRLQI